MTPSSNVVDMAISVAIRSPCMKSKRGCVVFQDATVYGIGYNHPPDPMICDGSAACREHCNKLCVHAEAAAIADFLRLHRSDTGVCHPAKSYEILHIKVVACKAVPSGPPSCWQCSRQILDAKFGGVWLLHEAGWRRYTATEFHVLTLQHHGLPVIPEVHHG